METLQRKVFISAGYYCDEPAVLIEVKKGKINLFNTLYDVSINNLKINTDKNGAYVLAAGKRYYIENFIQNNALLDFQQNENV